MKNKNLFFLLILPCTVLSNKTVDLHIQELTKARYDTELELAVIVEKIEAKEQIIDSLMLKAQNIFPHCVTTLNNEEIELLYNETISFQINFQKYLLNYKVDKEIFDRDFLADNQDNICELKRVKYLLMRYLLEYNNLNELIKKYEEKVKEKIQIDHKLNILQ